MGMSRFGPRIAPLEGEGSLQHGFWEANPVKHQTTTGRDSTHGWEGSGSLTLARQRTWARQHETAPKTYVSAASPRTARHPLSESTLPATSNTDVFLCALQSLAHALQAKDPYTAGHSMRVAAIAKAMAHELGCPADEVRQIGFSAELHDIGKIGVPEGLLHKQARLSDDEYAIVMRHTVIGEEIVAPLLHADPTVRQVVRWHHEHVDGSGSPDGLLGDEIPLAARIVAVADAFDAMTTARPYRPALQVEETLNELRADSGSHFDPKCVDILVALLRIPNETAIAT